MKINKTIETTEGGIHFQGELTTEEADLVIEIGLSVLLAQGAIPFTLKQARTSELDEDEDDEQEGPTLQ